jgi:hypothetical protein
LFGKLFCYICIIRSGRVMSDAKLQLVLLNRLLELHERKGWMREVVAETVLQLCAAAVGEEQTARAVLTKLQPLLLPVASAMSAWQLVLSIGLQQLLHSSHKVGAKVAKDVWAAAWVGTMDAVPTGKAKNAISISGIEQLTETLLASTHGYPKVSIASCFRFRLGAFMLFLSGSQFILFLEHALIIFFSRFPCLHFIDSSRVGLFDQFDIPHGF